MDFSLIKSAHNQLFQPGCLCLKEKTQLQAEVNAMKLELLELRKEDTTEIHVVKYQWILEQIEVKGHQKQIHKYTALCPVCFESVHFVHKGYWSFVLK